MIYKHVGFKLIIKKTKWDGDFYRSSRHKLLWICDSEIYMGLLCK